MPQNTMAPTKVPVAEFLAGVPERRRQEAEVLIEVMRRISDAPPVLWGTGIIGFSTYRYELASGREQVAPAIGFSPRKTALTIYVANGFDEYADLLARLGKHRTTVSCLYLNKLSDVDVDVLTELLTHSFATVRGRCPDSVPANRQALEQGSGIAWARWLRILEPHREASHAELARIAKASIEQVATSDNPGWWAQSVTVAYEQHIGRRVTGQGGDGHFSVTVSRTFPTTPHELLASWAALIDSLPDVAGVAINRPGRLSSTDKWHYWRCGLADGSRLTASMAVKPNSAKTTIAVSHERIAQRDMAKLRAYWRHQLAALAT